MTDPPSIPPDWPPVADPQPTADPQPSDDAQPTPPDWPLVADPHPTADPGSAPPDWLSVAEPDSAAGSRSTPPDWPLVAGLHHTAGRRSALRDWPSVASLHPAAGPAPLPSDPLALARACKVLAAAWPWSRLRAHPEAVDPPGLEAPPELAQWMDDGMWARWLLSAFPARDDLLDAVHNLLPPDLALAITQTVHEC